LKDQEAFETKMKDALGDIIIYWLRVCYEHGWNPEEIILDTAAHVIARNDYVLNEKNKDAQEAVL